MAPPAGAFPTVAALLRTLGVAWREGEMLDMSKILNQVHLLDNQLLCLSGAPAPVGHRHEDRVGVLLLYPPLLRRDGRDVGLGLGVEILLEQLGLSGDFERDHLAKSVVVQSVEPANLAGGDITSSLGHEADPPLRVRRLEGVDVVDERRLWCDLEVSDDAVSFPAQIDQIGVRVVDGEHDPVGRVQLHHHDGVV